MKIHKIIISPAALCECETWSLTLMELYRLRGFQNRVLMRIFWPGRRWRLKKNT